MSSAATMVDAMKPVPFTDARVRRVGAMLLAACLALLAGGCVTPLDLPPRTAALSPEAVGLDSGARMPEIADEWWHSFNDPALDDLIAKALRDNPSLASAAARLARAQALADRTDAEDWPQVQARVEDLRQRFPEHSLIPPIYAGTYQNYATAQLVASWQLDFFGRNRAAFEAALGAARAAEADAATARILLATQVTRSYVQLARWRAQREIAQRSLAQRTEVLALVRRRVLAGLDTAVELQQSEGALPESRQGIDAIDEQIVARLHALAALTVQPSAALDALAPRLDGMRPALLPSVLPADLLGRRADIEAARLRTEAAVQDLKAARADFYPSVNLVAFAGFNAIGLDRLFDSGSRQYGIGPAVRLPIFDAGRLRASQRGKAAELDAAIASYNAAVLEAVRDASDQINALQFVERQQREQTLAQDHAERAYRLAVRRFGAGLGSYLVVLSAESTVLSQRRAAVDLQARALDSQAELMRALGGGYAGAPSRERIE